MHRVVCAAAGALATLAWHTNTHTHKTHTRASDWRCAARPPTLSVARRGTEKLLGVLITIGEAVAYVLSGMYGDVRELGWGNAVLIILQA